MENKTYIYALTDPETGYVKYVGKTDRPAKRLKNHLNPSALAIKCRRTSWLRGLMNKGLMPGMLILEVVPVEAWRDRECYWIAFYRALGAGLVNTAEGGSGGVRPEWVTDEMRANMSAAKVGIKRSAESVRKQAEAQRGRKRNPETVAKMSAANKGKKPSAQCEAARLKAITGKKASEETRKKMSAASKGNDRAKKHDYIAIDKSGREYEVESLTEFCVTHGLNRARMSTLAAGDPKRKQHKGWTCRYK